MTDLIETNKQLRKELVELQKRIKPRYDGSTAFKIWCIVFGLSSLFALFICYFFSGNPIFAWLAVLLCW